MSKIFIGLKKTCLGVLDGGERDKDNEIGLKEGGVIKIETTVLPLRDARSLPLNTHGFLYRQVFLIVFKLSCFFRRSNVSTSGRMVSGK